MDPNPSDTLSAGQPSPASRSRPPAPDRTLSPDVIKAAAAIIALAALSALAVAAVFPERLSPAPAPGAATSWEPFADYARLEALANEPGAVLLDARIPELHALGRIPGALSLPEDRLEAGDPVAARLMASIPKDAAAIAYCSEPLCPLAARLADRLAAAGHERVYVFTPGFDGWLSSGRPVEEAPDGG
ncbi:MAG: hypothetical protein LBQ12_13855 [Deltaproteobacteria bacterium]|jgi:rhodanese-related sulfurtransferase|nr:hypothetical protein [Deltaproteobacteria bacterium]